MNQYAQMLKDATTPRNLKLTSSEANKNKKDRDSPFLNEIMLEYYPDIDTGNSKDRLFKIWSRTIDKAPKTSRGVAGQISRSWIKIFEGTDKLIKAIYNNENTSEKIISEFRKILRDKYGDKNPIYIQSIYKMGVSQERSVQRKAEYQAKVATKGSVRRTLKPIYDDQIYDIINKTINSEDPIERVLAVALSTGSRQIEIFKVSKYEIVPDRKEDDPEFIKITGIAKDRARQGYENKVIYRPLFSNITGKQIIEAVDYIRTKLVIPDDNKAITSKFNKRVNAKVKTYFEGYDYITAHKMRYIFPQLAYLLYGKGSVENQYVAEVLGHQDSNTAKSYQSINVQIRNLNSDVNNEEVAKLKSEVNKLNIINVQNDKIHKILKSKIDNTNNPDNLPEYEKYKNTKARDGRVFDRLAELVRYLKANKVYITRSKLRKYGYGSKVIGLVYDEFKL